MDDEAHKPPPLSGRSRDILQAAKRCFEQHGFHAASMAAIAAEAGISVGNVYRYFANKDAVIAAIVREDLEEIVQDIDHLSADGGEIAKAILAHFERTRSLQRTILRLEIMAEGARNPKVGEMIRAMETHLRNRMRPIVSAACIGSIGAEPFDDAEIEARMSLVGILMDGLQLRAIREGDDPPPRLIEHVQALLTQVLSSQPMIRKQNRQM